jgi:hypothetical protein
MESVLLGALVYHIGRKQSASIGDRATDQSLANWCVTGSGHSHHFDGLPMTSGLPPEAVVRPLRDAIDGVFDAAGPEQTALSDEQ